ncbi:hypothetical protein C5167_007716 [Papaver somniferum]|nr:hypothetical protein C5167_007716 [Papaver somniferum]
MNQKNQKINLLRLKLERTYISMKTEKSISANTQQDSRFKSPKVLNKDHQLLPIKGLNLFQHEPGTNSSNQFKNISNKSSH